MTTATLQNRVGTYRRELRCARQLSTFMALVTVWFLVSIIVIFAGMGVVQATTDGFGDGSWGSMWEYAENPMRYFPMAMGIVVFTTLLPVYIANSVTRREFAAGASLMVVGTSASLAVVGVAGFGVERLLFDWADQAHEYDYQHLFTGVGDFGWIFVEFALLTGIHMAIGCLIGTLYYRFGPWIATASLPLAVLPALAVEALLQVSFMAGLFTDTLGFERPSLALVIPACVVILGATLYLNYLFTRRLAVKP